MPFLFQWLCDLLEELDNNQHKRVITASRAQSYENQIVHAWYQRFSYKIQRTGSPAIAFLSCLLPERRPDRVYNLQVKRLSHVFGRALGLGAGRASELNQWQNREGVDFASCIELTLQKCENPKPATGKEVTLEEIDEALELIAAHSLFSSPAVRSKRSSLSITELLSPILRRLKSNEAKWLARMLLKTYAPVQIPERAALHGFHFMLPNLLKIQNSFDAAIVTLATEAIRQLPPRPDRDYENALQSLVSKHVHPQLGIMIKRQPYDKARSIKHCCKIAQGRQMSVERKYDGEYCQIHVNVSKGHGSIQIFSKSGKDSTNDRLRLHATIMDALRIGHNGCAIRKCCIVEGELLVWSDTRKRIQPFHKIRKHVKHGGREIGTARDSPRRSDEHLMIAFYDILMLDNHMLLNEPHTARRRYLKQVLQTRQGRAILCERKIIDFKAGKHDDKLRRYFAQSIIQGWEGLVLKGSNDPYFTWNNPSHGIKLKKDYITGLGDAADLCVVGGRRDPHVELQIGLGFLDWTCFYVGAVCNMAAIRRFDEKPEIMLVDILTHHSMSKADLLDFNRLGKLVQTVYAPAITEYNVRRGRFDMEEPSELFRTPFIVEIMGAGFEKLSNSPFYTLRFPRKISHGVKLHTDRTLLDTVSFSELQSMAERSFTIDPDKNSQEDAAWIKRLIDADGKRRNGDISTQEKSSVETLTSPAAMTSSPLNSERGRPSFMFVRLDTEEPETQHSSTSGIGSQVAPRADCVDAQRSSILTPLKLRYGSFNSHKRKLSSITVIEDKPPRRGREFLQATGLRPADTHSADLCHFGSPKIASAEQAIAATQPTGKEHEQIAVDNDHGVECDKLSSSQSISQQAADVDFVELNSTDSSLRTPESTLLMRQILSLKQRSTRRSVSASPTKFFTAGLGVLKSTSRKKTSCQLTDKLMSQRNRHTKQPPALILNWPEHYASTLPDAHAAFTYSPARFLSDLDSVTDLPTPVPDSSIPRSCPLFYRVILLNSLYPKSAAESFQALAHEVQSRLHSYRSTIATPSFENNQSDLEFFPDFFLNKYNNCILVFDIKVLDHEIVRNAGSGVSSNDNSTKDNISLVDVLRTLDWRKGRGTDAALFCGVLEFYPYNHRDEAAAAAAAAVTIAGQSSGPNRGRLAETEVRLALRYRFDWLLH